MKIVQNAYVVESLEEQCERLYKEMGIGPFLVSRFHKIPNHVYRGLIHDPIEIHVAFGQSGFLNIEIIELISAGPNAFSDMFGAGESGFHHVAYFCDDFEMERERITGLGYCVASEFGVDGVQFAIIDTRPLLGHMIELYNRNDVIFDIYERTRLSKDSWNGKDLFIQL